MNGFGCETCFGVVEPPAANYTTGHSKVYLSTQLIARGPLRTTARPWRIEICKIVIY